VGQICFKAKPPSMGRIFFKAKPPSVGRIFFKAKPPSVDQIFFKAKPPSCELARTSTHGMRNCTLLLSAEGTVLGADCYRRLLQRERRRKGVLSARDRSDTAARHSVHCSRPPLSCGYVVDMLLDTS
jgi:hypothetical protein